MTARASATHVLQLGEYPLHEAVGSGALESVKELLIDGNVDVNARDEVGATALHMAANVGSVEVRRRLVSAGDCRRNVQRTMSHVPGFLAQMVKLLLDHDADIEARDEDGLTPLAHAAISCDEDVRLHAARDACSRARRVACFWQLRSFYPFLVLADCANAARGGGRRLVQNSTRSNLRRYSSWAVPDLALCPHFCSALRFALDLSPLAGCFAPVCTQQAHCNAHLVLH